MKTRIYQSIYEFDCENKDIAANGTAHISFLMDDENDAYNIDLTLEDLSVWDVVKEQEVQTVRAWHIEGIKEMIEGIKEMIEGDAIQNAIEKGDY